MNFKRSVALMTVLVMLVAIFSGCSKGGSSDTKSGTSENESHVSADIFSKEKVTYKDAEGDSLYTIVRPAEATEDINKNASVLFGSLRKVSGTAPKNVADDVSDGKDAYEIGQLLETIGFKKSSTGRYEINLEHFFEHPCQHN